MNLILKKSHISKREEFHFRWVYFRREAYIFGSLQYLGDFIFNSFIWPGIFHPPTFYENSHFKKFATNVRDRFEPTPSIYRFFALLQTCRLQCARLNECHFGKKKTVVFFCLQDYRNFLFSDQNHSVNGFTSSKGSTFLAVFPQTCA